MKKLGSLILLLIIGSFIYKLNDGDQDSASNKKATVGKAHSLAEVNKNTDDKISKFNKAVKLIDIKQNEVDYKPTNQKEKELKTSRLKLAKALPTREDKIWLENMMSNINFIMWNLSLIGSTQEKNFTKQNEIKRIDAVSFIESSLEWKENPIREDIVRLVEEKLYSYSKRNVPERLKRSFAADYVDLYKAIAVQDLERAKEIYKKSKSLPVYNLLKFTNNFYLDGETS